jgi:hypothetical protein
MLVGLRSSHMRLLKPAIGARLDGHETERGPCGTGDLQPIRFRSTLGGSYVGPGTEREAEPRAEQREDRRRRREGDGDRADAGEGAGRIDIRIF